jgi:hypothetical protein
MEPIYKGHAIRTLIVNTGFGLWPAWVFQTLKNTLELDLNGINWTLVIVLSLCLVWTLPRPSYLFFEAKHILTKDGIAEPLDLGGVIVFGGMSLIGFATQIHLNSNIINFFGLSANLFFVIGLAAFASFGACLGLTDLQMSEIFLPLKVLEHIKAFLNSWKLILLCMSNTVLFSVLTFFFINQTPL